MLFTFSEKDEEMIWIVGYLVVGGVFFLVARRIAKRHQVAPPDPVFFALGDGPGVIALFFWPFLVPLWLWSEISAKRFKEKMDLLEAERIRNPYSNLSLDEKLDRLRTLRKDMDDPT